MKQITLKDILERAREQDFYKFKAGTDRTLEYHQEGIEQFLTKEITGMLNGLTQPKMSKRIDDNEDGASWNKQAFYYNQRETKFRDDIKEILNN